MTRYVFVLLIVECVCWGIWVSYLCGQSSICTGSFLGRGERGGDMGRVGQHASQTLST